MTASCSIMPKSPWAYRSRLVVHGRPQTPRSAAQGLEPGCPLYERVPTRDEAGHMLGDFMMLIPGLKERPGAECRLIISRVDRVLKAFPEVVFADMNLRLNLLWVSVRARPGVILDIACCMKFHVPEAMLVGPKTS